MCQTICPIVGIFKDYGKILAKPRIQDERKGRRDLFGLQIIGLVRCGKVKTLNKMVRYWNEDF